MAQAGLLLPDEPLFIVDKSWELQGTSRRGSKSKPDLFGKDNFKVSKAGPKNGQPQVQSSKLPIPQTFQTASSKETGGKDEFHFIAANEPGGRQDNSARKAVRKHARQHVTQTQNRSAATKQSAAAKTRTPSPPNDVQDDFNGDFEISTSEFALAQMVPDSTWMLYGNDNAREPIGLENYLHYYRQVIASNAYPLEKYMTFEVNAIRGTCFPLALSDRLFLQTIMLVSALHQSHIAGTAEPKLTDTLAQQVLAELRNRIAQKDVSDATLLSVSCIALLENLLGRHSQWYVHATGMKEMLLLRGGIDTIDISIRWKIYRADMVGAIDNLSKPLLPHPGIRTCLKDMCKNLQIQDDNFVTTLASGGVSYYIQTILQHMYQVTSVIKHAMKKNIPLNTYFYDNSVLQIQHDLLQVDTDNPLDESWRIASLVYMNTFTKSRPFAGANCMFLSQKLRASFKHALKLLTKKDHHVWLAVMGGLVSLETDDHDWFVQTLIHIVQACGCSTWSEVKDILTEVLWLDVLHDEAGHKLLSEVIAASPPNYNLD